MFVGEAIRINGRFWDDCQLGNWNVEYKKGTAALSQPGSEDHFNMIPRKLDSVKIEQKEKNSGDLQFAFQMDSIKVNSWTLRKADFANCSRFDDLKKDC